MKKVMFFTLALSGCMALMTSCDSGPKPMTAAEMDKAISEKTASQEAKLATELDKICDSRSAELVAAATDSIVAAKKAAMPAPAMKKAVKK
jgi:hypothetical protein